MNFSVLALTLLLVQIPKHNPVGIWQAETGSQFEIRLTDGDVHVKLVPGSNPKFIRYEVALKNQQEINTYKGTGTFVAKMENGKQCMFDTEWTFVVVSPDRIIGVASDIFPDPNTCAIKQKSQVQLDLKKKK